MKIIRAMKGRQILIGMMVLVLLPALMVGVIQAQGPGPQGGDIPQAPLGTAFTYQGRLSDGGSPANGDYDLRFMLYNALSGGSQVGSTVTLDDETVTDGLFTVQLDFGDVFDGTALWLEAAVRPGSSTGSYTILSPRQALTAAPYALYAVNIPQHDHFGQSWSGSATSGLKVQNDATSGHGVYGYVSASSGGTEGVRGRSASTEGHGVVGIATAITGTTYGVVGLSDSPAGRGVYGRATATSGTNYGVIGRSDSTEGQGVFGQASASSGTNYGVFGRSASPDGYGGFFRNAAGGTALYADGDVAQSLGADGLVKAAVCAECGTSATVHRYFNTVNDHVSISSVFGGNCILDFDFDLSDRFWIAVAVGTGDTVSCAQKAGYNDQLDCWRTDHNGYLDNGDIMVLVY